MAPAHRCCLCFDQYEHKHQVEACIICLNKFLVILLEIVCNTQTGIPRAFDHNSVAIMTER